MRMISMAAMILACAACQPYTDPTVITPTPGHSQAQSDGHGCSAAVTAAGAPEQASGRACQQANSSWRIVQNTPGLPTQEYLVPRPDQDATGASANPQQPADQSANAQPAANPPSCTT